MFKCGPRESFLPGTFSFSRRDRKDELSVYCLITRFRVKLGVMSVHVSPMKLSLAADITRAPEVVLEFTIIYPAGADPTNERLWLDAMKVAVNAAHHFGFRQASSRASGMDVTEVADLDRFPGVDYAENGWRVIWDDRARHEASVN